jgi:hypothetical protein
VESGKCLAIKRRKSNYACEKFRDDLHEKLLRVEAGRGRSFVLGSMGLFLFGLLFQDELGEFMGLVL